MTQPDPDALRLRWAEKQVQEEDPDTPNWRDEWADTLDHHER